MYRHLLGQEATLVDFLPVLTPVALFTSAILLMMLNL
jgi:hypothetical protein